jgi:hypothetical protein
MEWRAGYGDMKKLLSSTFPDKNHAKDCLLMTVKDEECPASEAEGTSLNAARHWEAL